MKQHTKQIDRLVVHHSASGLQTTLDDLHEWHVEERGWDAIGYHVVILQDGSRHRTRPITMQGAHAAGFNNGSIGVCLVGNNTDPPQRWTTEQVESLQTLRLALVTVFGTLGVFGHRDLAETTECPGVDVRPMLLGPRY